MLIPPDSMIRQGSRPGWEGGMHSFMRRVLATDLGRELYIERRTRQSGGAWWMIGAAGHIIKKH